VAGSCAPALTLPPLSALLTPTTRCPASPDYNLDEIQAEASAVAAMRQLGTNTE